MMILIWIATVASFLVLFGVHVLYWLDAREVRRDTSRFKMFAVRDQLVWLVAAGEMDEDDPAWQVVYTATNSLLDLSYKGTQLGCMLDDARTAHRVVKDPKFRARVNAIDEILRTAESKSSEFARVMVLHERALSSIRRARSPSWQWWFTIALVVILAPYTLAQRAVRDLFFHKGRARSTAAVALFAQRAQGSQQNPRFAAA